MKIAILTNQQFWNAPLGSASILRNRYRVFKKKYDVDVIYLHKQNTSVSPLKGINIKIEDINEKTKIKFHEFIDWFYVNHISMSHGNSILIRQRLIPFFIKIGICII